MDASSPDNNLTQKPRGRAWWWVLVIFAGSLPFGSALQYYFAGEPERNTTTRNWLVVGQAVLGIVIMGFGLYKQIQANRQTPPPDEPETKLHLND